MASTAVYRTLSQNYGTGGGITTISFWFKRARVGTNEVLTSSYYSGSYYGQFQLGSNDKLTIQDWRTTNVYSKTTNKLFRDINAWYHVCWSFNNRTGGSSSSNLWINGELITDWASETEYSYQATTSWNTDYTHYIGCLNTSSSQAYFSGIIADYYFIQGQEYNVSLFGETDTATGQWKPKTNPTIDYSGTGTNSCHLKFENSGNLDLDSGDNNLTFTTSGNLTQTEDCPSNVFVTMNRLLPSTDALTMENGNLYNGDQSPNNWQAIGSTLAAFTGKYYWEYKIESVWGSTSNTTHRHGIANYGVRLNENRSSQGDVAWTDDAMALGWQNSNGVRYSNSVTMTSEFGTYEANDILMFAVDLTNLKIYFGKNGTWLNSGDPTSGSSGTGAYSIPVAGEWGPYSETKYGSDNVSWNMGNGFFRTTDITSAGTNASNLGRFEYDVPTGYTALCTKGLNE